MALPTIIGSTASGAGMGFSIGGPVGGLIGGGVGLLTGLFASSAEDRSLEANEAQAAKNRAIAEAAAVDAERRGEAGIGRMRLQLGQLRGRQRTSLAAAGVVGDMGSGLDLQADTAGMAELDMLTARANAQREAWGFRQQSLQIAAQAAADRSRAEDFAFSNMLSGLGGLAGSLYQNRGAFGGKPKLGGSSASEPGDWVLPPSNLGAA